MIVYDMNLFQSAGKSCSILFCWPWWPLLLVLIDAGSQWPTIWQAALAGSQSPTIWQAALVASSSGGKKWWRIWVHPVSDWFLFHVVWLVYKVLHRFSLVSEVSEWSFGWIWSFHWHGSAVFSSSQWVLLSMDSTVFCSILISMVRSELLHSVTFYHGFWWSFWSISSWELILAAADSDTRSSAESGVDAGEFVVGDRQKQMVFLRAHQRSYIDA